MADERRVDVDERREPAGDPGSRRAAVVAGVAKLPPPREAWRQYVEHSGECKACQDIDRGACNESTRLYQAWQGIAGEALRDIERGA